VKSKWNDGDDKRWATLDTTTKNTIGFVKDTSDGVFFVEADDLQRLVDSLVVGHYEPTYHFSTARV